MTAPLPAPPKLGRLLLRLRPLGSRREEIEADLHEAFLMRLERQNEAAAAIDRAVSIEAQLDPTGARLARALTTRALIWQHALRPALLPVVTIVFLDAALMVAGTVVTESVFAWPGVGSLFTEALARRDYTVLMALLMVASTTVIVLNLIADVVYPLIDPRVRA